MLWVPESINIRENLPQRINIHLNSPYFSERTFNFESRIECKYLQIAVSLGLEQEWLVTDRQPSSRRIN